MKLKYKDVQALKYTLGQLINSNQGQLTVDNVCSPSMEYFVKQFKKENINTTITIEALFYFIEDQLDNAIIVKGEH